MSLTPGLFLVLLLALAVVPAATGAAAQADRAADATAANAVKVAQRWGLIGTWALDCSMPVEKGKGRFIFYEISPEQRLVNRRDHDAADANPIVDAGISPDRSIVLYIRIGKQTRENGIVKDHDGTIRALFNRADDGTYSIRDGLFVANGKPTVPLHKCD